MNDWGLDGFKLDFVDKIRSYSKGPVKEGMDYINVDKATDRLLTDISKVLRSINEKALIEFRQSYIGPLSS